MPFNVGDKVRFTDHCRAPWFFGPHTPYKTGVIESTDGYYARTYKVRVDGHDQAGSVDDEHIELIVEVPRKVFYTVVYKSMVEPDKLMIAGFETEARAEQHKARVGANFVKMKKITLSNV